MKKLWLALGLLAFGSPAAVQEGGSLLLQLADGTSFPLRSWSLSYEYSAWRRGESASLAATGHKEAREIWVGKRVLPVAGLTLEIQYQQVERGEEEGGEIRRVKVSVVKELSLRGRDGKKTVLRPDPPHPDLLVPAREGAVVQPRGLDLKGETLTGTKRDFCLLSYSSLLQCSSEPDQQVVKIEFPP